MALVCFMIKSVFSMFNFYLWPQQENKYSNSDTSLTSPGESTVDLLWHVSQRRLETI